MPILSQSSVCPDAVPRESKQNCFTEAISQNNWACVSVLLDVVAAGFSSDLMMASNPGSQRGPHVTDLLEVSILSLLFQKFPELASPFLMKLKLVPAYPFVQQGPLKYNLGRESKYVGSQERSPKNFWKKKDVLYSEMSQQSGLPVEAFLVPLEDIVGPESDLLDSIYK